MGDFSPSPSWQTFLASRNRGGSQSAPAYYYFYYYILVPPYAIILPYAATYQGPKGLVWLASVSLPNNHSRLTFFRSRESLRSRDPSYTIEYNTIPIPKKKGSRVLHTVTSIPAITRSCGINDNLLRKMRST